MTRIAAQLHEMEHEGGAADCCSVDWHTESWFLHMAERAYDSGERK